MRGMMAVAALSCVALCGCGDGGPRLVPVSGRVTLDGKALAGKTLKFVPEPKVPGLGAGASTDADGKYTLLAIRPGATTDVKGVPPGEYKVTVNEPMFPIDLAVQDSGSTEPTPAVGLPAAKPAGKGGIPAVYTSVELTPLKVTVPAAGGPIDLALESAPKK
ncbi:MAG: hypothetical protein ACRC33_31470 [Gemmataceae bacterium]